MGKNFRKGFAGALCLLLVCTAVLTACSAGSSHPKEDAAETPGYSTSSTAGEMGNAGMTGAAGDASPRAPQEDLGNGGDSGALGAAARPSDGEKLIENLYYQIETLQFDDSIKKVQSLYESLGGYVQESRVEGLSGQGLRSSHYVLRIPQDKSAQLKDRTAELGNVLRTDSNIENVTDEYYDIEARLKSLRAQEERLLALLEKSGSLEDIVQLEKALSDVTYQIEKLTGTLRNYDSLIQYMTVTIDLQEVTKETEVSQAPVTLGERISTQFHSTMTGLGNFGEAFLVFLVGSLPVLLLLALAAVIVILIVRRVTRLHVQKKQAEAKPQEPLANPEEDSNKKE